MANYFDQFDTQKQTGNFFDQFDQKPEPTEYGGLFGSAGAALKERFATALPAAKLYTGLGDQKAATDELAKHKEEADNAYKQVEFGEIGDAFKQGNYADALGKTVEKFKEVAGSSFGTMAPAMGAGAVAGLAAETALGAAAAATVGIPAAAVGTVAFGLTALGSYIADGIARQKEEQAKAGKPYEDINRVSATVAGAGEAALDVFGFKFFKPLGRLVGINGKEAAEGMTKEIIQAATQPRAYAKAVAKGAAKGVAFEVPQEVTQQVLERWQAGLPLNPFDDPDAAKEYLEAAGGALMLGGPFGAYHGLHDVRAARATPEAQAILKDNSAQRGNQLTRTLEGEPDVTESVGQTNGAGVSVVGKPPEGSPAAGATATQRGGVDVTGANAAGPAGGTTIQPGALNQQGTTNVDETAEAQQTEAQRQKPPSAPALTDEEIAQAQEVDQEAYNDVLGQVKSLLALPSLTGAQNNMLGKLRAELTQINPKGVQDEQVDGVPLNEAVDQKRQANQPRAMQGEMFGTPKAVSKFIDMALAMAGQDPTVAIQKLQESKQRLVDRLQANGFDNTWAMQIGRSLGLTPRQAIDTREKLAAEYVQRSSASIDQAIEQLSQREKGQPRAMKGTQEGLFGANNEAKIDEGLKDLFVEGKTTEQTAEPETQKETVKAPETSTEHVETTGAGSLIKRFFDAILPNTNNTTEQAKHEALRDETRDAFLQYDITEPGQKSSPGINAALQYLADLVGGQQRFNELLDKLQGSDATTQRSLLTSRGLPDLTSRKALEKFAADMQKNLQELPIIKALPAGTERTGVSVPTQNRAAPATGENKGVIPHTAEVTVHTKKATEHGVTPEGKPRRPNIIEGEKKYTVQDTKLRSAWRHIKQLIANRQTPSVEALAAKNYMENPGRETFGDVLNDLAYDLAYGEPANHTFQGEGGKYALAFQKWINENLDPSTVETLNNLIEDQKQNRAEEEKYNAAVTKYNEKIEAIKKTNAENKLKKAEKTSGTKIPRAPRISERIPESTEMEETPSVQVSKKGLPRVQMLAEVHPAILRMIKAGDTKGALKILAEAKDNPFYSALASRLLEADITAKTKIIGQNEMIPLSNDPKVATSLKAQLSTAADMVEKSLPDTDQVALVQALKSDNLNQVQSALYEIESKLTNESQKQVISDIRAFVHEQYNWQGKYDPNTDEISYRQGYLSNHVFFHENIHAATLGLIDDPESLTGPRRAAYDQLEELYNHSKGMLSSQGLNEGNTYGLSNLHEFVSEAMTNPDFQYLLKGIRYKAAPFSLWDTFSRAVAKLFGVKPGYESNVMVEAMNATNILMRGTASFEGPSEKANTAMNKTLTAEEKTKESRALKTVPPGLQNTPTTVQRLMQSRSWAEVRHTLPILFNSAKADFRPKILGALTLRQIGDLVNNRIPQINNFIKQTEAFLAHKDNILQKSGDISKAWERMQSADPEMSRRLGRVMHAATILEVDPDKTPIGKQIENQQLRDDWNALDGRAKVIYRRVRDFYDDRYAEYKRIMMRRVMDMRKNGLSEASILEIRNEFEKNKRKGPYFPLMRHGRFWYQIGRGNTREYYMFETAGQKEMHMAERIARNPELEDTIKDGSEYAQQMDVHAKQSNFLKTAFEAIDSTNFTGPNGADEKQNLKDSIYQNFLANQPEHSFRRQFMHRNNIAGYSEDALRNFASSSFHIAYQLSRFQYSPDMFSQVQAARTQVKDRFDVSQTGFDKELSRERNELNDYITEMDKRLKLMLNPTDTGMIPSLLSNIGFIWYLTAPASAIVNVVGGTLIGLPTLVGQNVRLNPNKSYARATLEALSQMKSAASQIIGTGFSIEKGERLRDNRVLFPTLNRSNTLTGVDKAAYNKFVADGLIDITATYDQSGLASAPTDSYGGIRNRSMEMMTALFHNTERFNREIMAMSAFRTAMEKRSNYTDKQKAFAESIAEAKDVTQRSMFDYSAANKPRYLQNPTAKILFQFKQFPQQMTYFLAHNAVNMFKGMDEATRREARARFVGTMGMAGIFSGATGLWGFSAVAGVMNAVINGMKGDDDEPFDFELEFVNWAIETFGVNMGTLITRGMGNAAGIDLASRVKLDDMWFRDSRKNQDEVQALQTFLVDLLGPTAGLLVNVAEAHKLFNEGHSDRAIEMILPAILKNPAVAARYGMEGAKTLNGDILLDDMGPFTLMMQSLGIRSSELAELQYYNITVKGQEQAILKERQNLLNLYSLAFMSNDSDMLENVYTKMDKFNDGHPSVYIPADSLTKAIKGHMKKSAETEHGLYIDKRLRGILDAHDYTRK